MCRSNKFADLVASLLKAAGYAVQQEVTRHAHHATQIAASLDLAQIGCIAIVGGDGTFHEVLQVRSLPWLAANLPKHS